MEGQEDVDGECPSRTPCLYSIWSVLVVSAEDVPIYNVVITMACDTAMMVTMHERQLSRCSDCIDLSSLRMKFACDFMLSVV